MKRFGKCIGKRKYAWKHKALKAAAELAKRYRCAYEVYECPTCLDFHLTTKRGKRRKRRGKLKA